jgi:metal-responsive CopG/Arc/MetJ family transcriptional regulator
MKTAISIPDPLFQAAERLGLSRSELYATALREYLQSHREINITQELDALYAVKLLSAKATEISEESTGGLSWADLNNPYLLHSSQT